MFFLSNVIWFADLSDLIAELFFSKLVPIFSAHPVFVLLIVYMNILHVTFQVICRQKMFHTHFQWRAGGLVFMTGLRIYRKSCQNIINA